jgi:hypothetical protein
MNIITTQTTQDVRLTVRLTVRAGDDLVERVRDILERELPFGSLVHQVGVVRTETIDQQ